MTSQAVVILVGLARAEGTGELAAGFGSLTRGLVVGGIPLQVRGLLCLLDAVHPVLVLLTGGDMLVKGMVSRKDLVTDLALEALQGLGFVASLLGNLVGNLSLSLMTCKPRKFGEGVGSEGVSRLASVKGLLLDGLTLELEFAAASASGWVDDLLPVANFEDLPALCSEGLNDLNLLWSEPNVAADVFFEREMSAKWTPLDRAALLGQQMVDEAVGAGSESGEKDDREESLE